MYHALTPTHAHLALKIYKTSILIFKDRDRYVTGEYRFRRGYSRHNPRKMVRVWAEKEMRNLKRLVTAGIPCPEPIEVRENVLVMTFLGDEEGWYGFILSPTFLFADTTLSRASPRLKDASIPTSELEPLYRSLLLTMHKMYHLCKLVHADLSEYNILYHLGQLYIIDVSQSVEHDHPSAFDFLRKDIKNVDDFFAKAGVAHVLGLRRTFEFVTREMSTEQASTVLDELLSQAPPDEEEEQHDEQDDAAQGSMKTKEDVDESVFMKAYIPRTLDQVYDPERDVAVLNRGGGDNLIYKDLIGVVPSHDEDGQPPPAAAARGVRFEGARPEDEDEGGDGEATDPPDSEASSDEEAEEGEGAEGEGFVERKPRGHRHEDKGDKKERKKAVKEEARERRKQKMPKAEKKKKIKASRGGK